MKSKKITHNGLVGKENPSKLIPVKNETSKVDPKASKDMLVDFSLVSLFNAMAETLGLSFRLPSKVSITKARSIVQNWCPQMYDTSLDPYVFARQYALSKFFDKYISVEEQSEVLPKLQSNAAKKFLEINKEGLNFDRYALSNPELKPLFDRMAYTIGEVLSDFSLREIYESCQHGPNSTTNIDFLNAYIDIKDFDISGPSGCLQQFIHYLNTYNLSLKEVLMDTRDDLRYAINAWTLEGLNVVDYTELSIVPKNYKALRTMCPEQTLPSWFGQGVGKAIANRLQKIGIQLETQPSVHKMLARLGSLYPDLNLATVDWSGASDRIWIALCYAVMTQGKSHQYFDFIMNVCRCKFARITFNGEIGTECDFDSLTSLETYCTEMCFGGSFDIKVRESKGKVKKTYFTVSCEVISTMIGTMGNAVTFPLQTLMFYAFLDACTFIASDRLKNTNGPNHPDSYSLAMVSAFGDDGICDCRAMPEISYFADLIGWQLNKDKSYWEGSFRESCGGDYYKGMETRAITMKRPPVTPYTPKPDQAYQAWSYLAANSCIEFLDRFGLTPYKIDAWLVEFHKTFKLGRICVVPPFYPEGSGLRVVDLVSPYYYKQLDHVTPVVLGLSGVGYGLDPTLYHVPWFSTIGHEYVFYCLGNRSLSRRPSQEYSYYVRALQGLSPHEDISVRYLSFFDQHKVVQSRLDVDGLCKIKECRLEKSKVGILSWSLPYDLLINI